KRIEGHDTVIAQPGGTGVIDDAVNGDRTFLAHIRVDAAVADSQRGILSVADPDQRVEHARAVLERHREFLISERLIRGAAPPPEICNARRHSVVTEIAPSAAMARR